MVIQRLQTLWLLCALVCAGISFFYPMIYVDGSAASAPCDAMPLILAGLATLLPAVGIALFRNLRRQKLVAAVAALMALVTVGYVAVRVYVVAADESLGASFGPAVWMLAASALFDLLARRSIVHDEKLLKSADRLR